MAIRISKTSIEAAFKDCPHVITPSELYQRLKLLDKPFVSRSVLIARLLEISRLKEVRFSFPSRPVCRYTWGKANPLAVVQSIDPAGYFSHYTAMRLHSLTDQIPKILYFNVEQRLTGGGGDLSQGAIDRAFANKCRVTTNYADFDGQRVVKLNGQNTQRLGVVKMQIAEATLSVTDIERTLIDGIVRPVYAGGIGEVVAAFQAAEKANLEKLATYLEKLNFTYPYHQAIGFCLQKTGRYSSAELEPFRSKIVFDFYLGYQIKNPGYAKEWKLFVPKGLEL